MNCWRILQSTPANYTTEALKRRIFIYWLLPLPPTVQGLSRELLTSGCFQVCAWESKHTTGRQLSPKQKVKGLRYSWRTVLSSYTKTVTMAISRIKCSSRVLVPKLYWTSESPGGFIDIRISGLHLHSFWFRRCDTVWEFDFFISSLVMLILLGPLSLSM